MAAASFSRQCAEIQSRNMGATLDSFFDEQIACVLISGLEAGGVLALKITLSAIDPLK